MKYNQIDEQWLSVVLACSVVTLSLWKLMKKKKETHLGLITSLEVRSKCAEAAQFMYKATEVEVCLQGWTANKMQSLQKQLLADLSNRFQISHIQHRLCCFFADVEIESRFSTLFFFLLRQKKSHNVRTIKEGYMEVFPCRHRAKFKAMLSYNLVRASLLAIKVI